MPLPLSSFLSIMYCIFTVQYTEAYYCILNVNQPNFENEERTRIQNLIFVCQSRSLLSQEAQNELRLPEVGKEMFV
jgi:hypothetical protein